MSKYNIESLANLKLTPIVKQKLSLSLNNVIKGNDSVILTPLGKSRDTKLILKDFDEIFNKPGNIAGINSELKEIELSNRSKYGPRSIQKPWLDRRESVLEYFDNEVIGPDLIAKPPLSKDMFKLRPISMDKAVSFLKNNTSSGLPELTNKGSVKANYSLKQFESEIEAFWPAMLYTRTQEGNKTRNIWGLAISQIINETMFYRPLLDYQKNLSWRSALIGPDVVDRQLTEIVNSSLLRNVSLVSIDFSRYDASVKRRLQRYAFDYISMLFQKQFSSRIDKIFEMFNTVGIVTPDGIIYGSHGVPSGSAFTNEVDSIVQYLIAINSKLVFRENIQIQGDDGIYIVNQDNSDKLFRYFESHGLVVGREKSKISQNSGTYLQKYYSADYRNSDGIIGGIYSVYRALNRLVFQERWTDFEDYGILGRDYYSIRSICILENCKHHPLFTELVKFVLSQDKYKLSYSQDGLNKYVRMLIETKGSEGLLINQYGDDLKGINSFETVKLIKTLV